MLLNLIQVTKQYGNTINETPLKTPTIHAKGIHSDWIYCCRILSILNILGKN